MNTNKADCEQTTSCAVSVILVPSLRAITICPLSNSLRSAAFPITRKSKCKNDYLPSPAAVKYHSHLTTCPPHHPDEFIEKCGDGHNILARQCMYAGLHQIYRCLSNFGRSLYSEILSFVRTRQCRHDNPKTQRSRWMKFSSSFCNHNCRSVSNIWDKLVTRLSLSICLFACMETR
ncbi:hypothetical protein AVEN_202812-1 [Araneus ventricosus]|uniref:Uncharacterized protein n=1 Tax=Araneus ventricosus TaxID=182803 RepID=A0A4Y2DP86_ARAVE|nr:hypothetical protein AVEN_202812-1 [Araneus ventricosus]